MPTISTEKKAQNHGSGLSLAGGNRIICFDVDGTLRDYSDRPRDNVIRVLRKFVARGWSVYVWSGGGRSYAESIGRSLGLEGVKYTDKVTGVVVNGQKVRPQIAVDDQRVSLGVNNIYVGLKGDPY